MPRLAALSLVLLLAACEAPSDAPEAEAPAPEADAAPAPAPPSPVAFAASGTGLRATLPPGWATTEADEGRLPAYARYAFAGPTGTRLIVERVVGLNELARQRWTRGLTPYGYHGLTAVGPAAVPVSGLGVEVAGPGVGGAVGFVQRGQTFWAVHVQAPEAAWRADRDAVLALVAGVALP